MIQKRQQSWMGKTARSLSFWGGAASFSLGLLSLPSLVFNLGSAALLAFGGTAMALPILWDRFDGWGRVPRRLHEVSDHRRPPVPSWWKKLRISLAACLALGAAVGTGLSIAMAAAIWNTPPENATVIVLGCKVYGSQPSPMLQRRLNTALKYLEANPESVVVCSGGQSAGDPYSEAKVMAQYLYDHKISQERIFLEEKSTSTAENLTFSAQIIRDNGLPTEIALATDGFHQLRSQIFSRKNGLKPSALPASTSWNVIPCYWVREWLGLAKALFQ